MTPTPCPLCGGPVITTSSCRTVHLGKRTAQVQLEAPECQSCSEVFYSPADMDTLQSRASTAIREREGLLQPEAIRQLRESFKLSQTDFERLLGVGPKTVVRWERGTVFQNGATDSLLRILAAVPEAARHLAAIKGVQLEHSVTC